MVFSGTLWCHFQSLFLPWGPFWLPEKPKNAFFPFPSFMISCHVLPPSSFKESDNQSHWVKKEKWLWCNEEFPALGMSTLPLQYFQTYWFECYSKIIFICNETHIYLSSVQKTYYGECNQGKKKTQTHTYIHIIYYIYIICMYVKFLLDVNL